MQIDSTNDFYLLDNLEPMTLRVTGQPDLPIAAALNEPADWKDPDQAGGKVLQGDQLWVWPIAASPIRPPLGSLIVDADGVAWTILSITRKQHVNTWEAHTRALAITYGLNNVAAVHKATYRKSPAGEALATYSVLMTGIPARFQPIETTDQIYEDAEWPKTTYHVFLGTDIFAPQIPVQPASADYRLVDSAGRHYRIMQYTRPERIDVLPVAVCVLIIEGAEGGAIDRIGSSSGA
jgi:hypothetical protein